MEIGGTSLFATLIRDRQVTSSVVSTWHLGGELGVNVHHRSLTSLQLISGQNMYMETFKVGRASGRVYVWVGWGLCTELNIQLDMGELIDVEGQLTADAIAC